MIPGGDKQPWGFWVLIRDEKSANWAVRMSGLVIFLMGFLNLFLALFAWYTWFFVNIGIVIIYIFMGILFLYAGWKIRAGEYGFLLFSTPFFLFNYLISIYYAPLTIVGVSTLQLILLVSGLRGWWWLRKQRP